MTDMEVLSTPWKGERGFIDVEMIKKYTSETKNAIYYSAGPQEMVLAMKSLITDMGIDTDNFRFEEFTGY